MSRKKNQHSEVLRHLQEHGTITSVEAIELYGATRLSAIIFNLRKSYLIETHDMVGYTRYGDTCHYAKYEYIRPLKPGEYLEIMLKTMREEDD